MQEQVKRTEVQDKIKEFNIAEKDYDIYIEKKYDIEFIVLECGSIKYYYDIDDGHLIKVN